MENPYWNSGMIEETKYFFGRKNEIETIFNRIRPSRTQCVSIVGERKVGKSSLLYYILKSDRKKHELPHHEKYIFAYFSFQQCLSVTVKEFWRMLYQELEDKLPDTIGIERVEDEETFENMAETLHNSGYRLILLLDELDKILKNKNFESDFLSYLRSIAENPDYSVAYVISTKKSLEDLCQIDLPGSPFFNIFTPIYLGLFQEDEALDLIRIPSAEEGIPLEEEKDFILEYAGLFPFFIQLLCRKLFERKKKHGLEIDPGGYKDILTEFRKEADQHFNHAWKGLSEKERDLLIRIAVGKEVKHKDRSVARRLKQKGYIIINEKTKIFSETFREFILEVSNGSEGGKPETKKRKLYNLALRYNGALGRNRKVLLPTLVGALLLWVGEYVKGGLKDIWPWRFLIIFVLLINVAILLFSSPENDQNK